MSDRKKVLVAPLDWGLGHATRCIPLIHGLVNADFEVLIAAEGHIRKLLELEFSTLEFVHLEGYRIKYAYSRQGLIFRLMAQVPHIIRKISYENGWLRDAAIKHNINIVISDNRYGLYHPRLYSVFMTHQLSIKTPFLHNALQHINYRLINKFDECWIPDLEEGNNLSGSLSHPKQLPLVPLKYVGLLSRFKMEPTVRVKEDKILVLLSGPEPQRTIFENILVNQLEDLEQHVVFIRGLPGEMKTISLSSKVNFINHLPAKELEIEIKKSSLVIARAGYSTIMDLITLKKKSILIPTPGQTEQEYLGTHLTRHMLALSIPQAKFELKKALHQAKLFPYKTFDNNSGDFLSKAIDALKTDQKENPNNKKENSRVRSEDVRHRKSPTH